VAAAAAALDMTPVTRGSRSRTLAVAVVLSLLFALGAAGAAYVFRDQVAAILSSWQNR
jgi:hypothetical protein